MKPEQKQLGLSTSEIKVRLKGSPVVLGSWMKVLLRKIVESAVFRNPKQRDIRSGRGCGPASADKMVKRTPCHHPPELFSALPYQMRLSSPASETDLMTQQWPIRRYHIHLYSYLAIFMENRILNLCSLGQPEALPKWWKELYTLFIIIMTFYRESHNSCSITPVWEKSPSQTLWCGEWSHLMAVFLGWSVLSYHEQFCGAKCTKEDKMLSILGTLHKIWDRLQSPGVDSEWQKVRKWMSNM